MSGLNITILLTKGQINAVLDLLEDELEAGEQDADDRPSLEAAKRKLEVALKRFERRQEREKVNEPMTEEQEVLQKIRDRRISQGLPVQSHE